MIAVDTSVWIDWLNDRDTRHTEYLDSLISAALQPSLPPGRGHAFAADSDLEVLTPG